MAAARSWGEASKRLVIVQYGGDYREAYERLSGGGEENYHAQRYSVEVVGAFAQALAVATVCCVSDFVYDEPLPNGVRAVGAGLAAPVPAKPLIRILERLEPTRLVLRTPVPELLTWSTERAVPTILTLAETLPNNQHRPAQVRLMNHPAIEWVGCHQLTSVPHYVRLGVDPTKVVAWRFPVERDPGELAPKRIDDARPPFQLLFVGSLIEEKGVIDALQGVAHLRSINADVVLCLVGPGEPEPLRAEARRLGIEDRVRFTGAVPASSVPELMRRADVVVIPSRREYPEALPNVLEHSWCARTPAVVSRHPAFADSLEHRCNAMLFAPGDARALAASVHELISDPELYHRISQAAPAAFGAAQAPVLWGELIDAWLNRGHEGSRWLRARSAAAQPRTSAGVGA
jgi:glycosyltransferase involved in cell wall biosynthesis